MYPQQTFNNFQDLFNYINSEWVTNGAEDIDAIIGNNVTNGILEFVTQSPLNWQKAQIISGGGVVVPSRPISVIMTTTPTSLGWVDNIYNQYIFINTTGNAIPLTSGMFYYDINLVAKNSIPAKTILSIAKAANSNWISVYNSATGGNPVDYTDLQFEIGAAGSPMNAGDVTLVITVDGAIEDAELIFLDGSFLYKSRSDRISYTVVYTGTSITITFNQGVSMGQLYSVKYATQ